MVLSRLSPVSGQALSNGFQCAQLHQWRKGTEERQREVSPAKAYRVRHGLPIDAHRDYRRIGQANLYILVARLGRNTIPGTLQQFLLCAW